MDEEISIIDTNTRNEKIIKFFVNNKIKFATFCLVIIMSLIGYFSIGEFNERNKIKIANKFNLIKINFKDSEKQKTIIELIDIINQNDATYSPLSLYFLLDNNLLESKNKTNELFDELINNTDLEIEIKKLVIYKKALFNSNFASENDLLQILNPIINSESIWKSHALYLLGEYFYSKDQPQKAKQFFYQIIALSNSNNDIKEESQKRLNRDLGE